jgi:hypothetical protein
MTDKRGGDAEGADLDLVAGNLVELEPAGKVAEMDGEERRGKIFRKACSQAESGACRSPDMSLDLWIEQRRKEPEALDMIQMKMCQQKIDTS